MINNAANNLKSGKEINAEIFDVRKFSPNNNKLFSRSFFMFRSALFISHLFIVLSFYKKILYPLFGLSITFL